MTKYYVILSNENEVAFPIKAVLSPYEDPYTRKVGPARCGGMPQFFGGRAGYRETPLAFLKREVQQQTINTFSLDATDEELRDVLTTTVNGERYVFFRSERWSQNAKDQWPKEEFWNLLEPEYREMCWIAKIPKRTFQTGDTAISDKTTKLEVLLLFNRIATLNAPQWVKDQVAKASVKQFADFATSETLTAFFKFLRCWCLN